MDSNCGPGNDKLHWLLRRNVVLRKDIGKEKGSSLKYGDVAPMVLERHSVKVKVVGLNASITA